MDWPSQLDPNSQFRSNLTESLHAKLVRQNGRLQSKYLSLGPFYHIPSTFWFTCGAKRCIELLGRPIRTANLDRALHLDCVENLDRVLVFVR
jgi:hypothetical protein